MSCRVTCLIVAAIILGLSGSEALAQDATLRGKVTDAETGEPLIAANVVATMGEHRIGASTLAEGNFVLPGLPAGIWRVTVTYIGYRQRTLEDVRLAPSGSLALEIELTRVVLTVGETVVVSASKRPERALHAPASVTVVEKRHIERRPTLTPSEHVTEVQGVDLIRTGLAQDRIVVRGLNSAISDRLLTLTDYRIARVPSLRFNVYQLIPATDRDIERIEIVAGPAAALYGPNAAGGVMHLITKSPFDSRGTSVSVGGGERSLLMNSFRHAGVIGEKIGYRISARHYRGRDWEYRDPAEPDSIVLGTQTPSGRVALGGLISNERDLDVRNTSGEARVDYRPDENTKLVVSGGISSLSDIEITGIGAFQVDDWAYSYLQARLAHNDLFAQVFLNKSDAGNTFNLRNGDLLSDMSSQFVAQVQHGVTLMDGRERLDFGADLLLTRPDTEGSLHGRNEDDDDINEIGAFVQSETTLSPTWSLVAAARLDDHNRVDSPVLSPRVALVYEPDALHNFRLTYNRAFVTPRAQLLFMDYLASPTVGPFPYAVRVRGVPESGWNFRRDSGGGIGGLYMQSVFTPPAMGGPATYLPADATVMWDAVAAFLQTQGIDLTALPAPTPGQVGTSLAMLDTNTELFNPVTAADVTSIPPYDIGRTTSIEFGYKGLVRDDLFLVTNLYHEKTNLPGEMFLVRTPNVFFEEATLGAYLGNFMTPAEAAALASTVAAIPVGTVTPEEGDPADLIATTVSFGELAFYGAELGVTFMPSEKWTLSGTYTYMSKNFFPRRPGEPDDLTLNAPRFKFGGSVNFRDREKGIDCQVRSRFVDSFRVVSGQGRGVIDSYTVVDLSASYRLPFYEGLELALSVQNLLDSRHREYVAVPEIGRLAMLRLTYSR
jgi:iron complex outermembrane receptor protein